MGLANQCHWTGKCKNPATFLVRWKFQKFAPDQFIYCPDHVVLVTNSFTTVTSWPDPTPSNDAEASLWN